MSNSDAYIVFQIDDIHLPHTFGSWSYNFNAYHNLAFLVNVGRVLAPYTMFWGVSFHGFERSKVAKFLWQCAVSATKYGVFG